jgi:hypothetical protein
MAAAGISQLAGDPEALVHALNRVTEPGPVRWAQVAAGEAMFVSDGALHVLEAARQGTRQPAELAPWRRPVVAASRVAAGVAAVVALTWAGLTTGVGVAAAEGAGVAHASAAAGRTAYFGVRLTDAELVDPAIQRQITALGISAVVDQDTADAEPVVVEQLAATGVDVDNGGQGAWYNDRGDAVRPTLWTRAHGDVEAGHKLGALIGQQVSTFVPGRRVNAFDLVDCHSAHSAIVIPNAVFSPADSDVSHDVIGLTARHIYLVNGLRATPAQVSDMLGRLAARLRADQLQAAPLAALR